MVGANTIRRDNPRLIVHSEQRRPSVRPVACPRTR
ncbi:hypothetical protein [Kutzneria kofuensis]